MSNKSTPAPEASAAPPVETPKVNPPTNRDELIVTCLAWAAAIGPTCPEQEMLKAWIDQDSNKARNRLSAIATVLSDLQPGKGQEFAERTKVMIKAMHAGPEHLGELCFKMFDKMDLETVDGWHKLVG